MFILLKGVQKKIFSEQNNLNSFFSNLQRFKPLKIGEKTKIKFKIFLNLSSTKKYKA